MMHGPTFRFHPAQQRLTAGDYLKWFVFFMLSVLAVFIATEPALAQASGGAGSFSCSNGQAVGELYDSGTACPSTLNFDNIFSFLVCNIEHLSSDLMGRMFCGMISDLAPAISAVLALATVIFGMGFTIGVIPATARDFQVFLLKMAFIGVFATQSDFLINIGYRFFVSGLRDGVSVALSGFNPSNSTGSGAEAYSQLDTVLGSLIRYATDYIGATSSGNPNDNCQNAVFAVIAIMAVAFPPLFFLALILLVKLAITFVRAVFGYVYALVGISFLLTLAPFFLSFYLFKQTRNFFEKWVGYIAAFALQIVILFIFLSFILSIDLGNMNKSLLTIIMPISKTAETTAFRAPWEYCTVCDFKIVDAQGKDITNQKDFLNGGTLVCKDTPPKPIDLLATIAPQQGAPTNKTQQNALLRFATGGLIALIILAAVMEKLLANVASLAQTLAGGIGGASYVPQLGGGTNITGRPTVDMPGDGLYTDFETGFSEGYGRSNNALGGTVEGFKSGMRRMIGGETPSGQVDPQSGAKNRFIDWLTDPSSIDTR